MHNAEFLIQKLMRFYKVFTISELADRIGVSQPSISGWKKNNYIKAIGNKCRELGIYDEIFGDLNSGTIINQGNNSRAAGNNYKERTNNSNEHDFDSITIGLIEKAIEKFGTEEEFQFQFMNFLRDK